MAQILVIDDDIAICKMIETALTRDGHFVITKTSACEVTTITLKNVDLILLDIMMPQLDGLLVGGDDYIKKPFGISELRARVNAHIRREHRDKHQSLILDYCVFDLSEKTVTV